MVAHHTPKSPTKPNSTTETRRHEEMHLKDKFQRISNSLALCPCGELSLRFGQGEAGEAPKEVEGEERLEHRQGKDADAEGRVQPR